MSKFIPGGPERFDHQKRGLRQILKTKGVTALLMDPGTGKTYTALDYCSILAMKLPPIDDVQEARILVVAPSAATDSWVTQAAAGLSPQVDFWAEVLGGRIYDKGEALAARGGNYFKRGTKPSSQNVAPTALNVSKSEILKTYAKGHTVYPRRGLEHFPGNRPRVTLIVINMEAFSRRDKVRGGTLADHMLESVKRFRPDLVIVDEMHKLKSPSSNTSRLLGRVADNVDRRLGLTGTVMPNGPLDVYGQWRFLQPYAFGIRDKNGNPGKASFAAFKDRYAELGGYMGREVVGYKNLDELQDVMALNSIVVKKEDALDLPETTDSIVPFSLSAAEAKAYENIREDLATIHEDGSYTIADNPLTRSLRLRQITSGFLPDDSGEIRELGMSKTKAITSLVNDTLLGEDRVVVFCQFSHEIAALRKSLSIKGTEVLTITGKTKHDTRINIRKRFGSDSKQRMVLIAQVATLSLAVNELVTASHAVYGSMTLQRADYIQSKDRLNRMGQTRPVTFWHVEAAGSIDQAIRKSHQDGTNLEKAVLDHILRTT